MALRYVVKKRMIGFGKENLTYYELQKLTQNSLNFKDLCEKNDEGPESTNRKVFSTEFYYQYG